MFGPFKVNSSSYGFASSSKLNNLAAILAYHNLNIVYELNITNCISKSDICQTLFLYVVER